jgi:hypothetical protein
VVFLTKGQQRAEHILSLASECARNPRRLLCYATTQDQYLTEPLAVTEPIVNDHNGRWQSLVNVHPTSEFLREPIRLARSLAPTGFV